MEWVQTLVIAAVPAVAAVGALLYQEKQAIKRERWRASRDTALRQFEEVRAVHLEMLNAIVAYWRICDRPSRSLKGGTYSEPAILEGRFWIDAPDPARMDAAFSALQVYVSKEHADVAGEAMLAAGRLGEALAAISEVPSYTYGEMKNFRERAHDKRMAYSDLLRDEIDRLRPDATQAAPPARSRR